jgi:hypothetical protein
MKKVLCFLISLIIIILGIIGLILSIPYIAILFAWLKHISLEASLIIFCVLVLVTIILGALELGQWIYKKFFA